MQKYSDVLYEVFSNPKQDIKEGESEFHVRLVNNGTVSTDDLDRWSVGSVNIPQMRASLEILKNFLIEHLREGREVHVNGLGYFKVNIQAARRWVKETDEAGNTIDVKKKHIFTTPEKIRAEHIEFKSISFRPEADVKRAFLNMNFVRSEIKSHSRSLTADEIDAKLAEYFNENMFLDRKKFQNLCGYTSSTARRVINRLVDEKKLVNVGRRNFPLYIKG